MHEFLFLKPETSVVSCRNEFVKKYNFTSIFAKLSALNLFSKTLKIQLTLKQSRAKPQMFYRNVVQFSMTRIMLLSYI